MSNTEESDTPVSVSPAVMLQAAIDLVKAARPMPLSSSVVITKEEVLHLLEGVQNSMPAEIREARWLLKERDEYLEQARAEADAIIREASSKAEQLVQRTEVTRASEERARRVVADAQASARKLQHEVEDFCDQRLAQFESLIQKTGALVVKGRKSFQVRHPEPDPESETEDPQGFFDQDHT